MTTTKEAPMPETKQDETERQAPAKHSAPVKGAPKHDEPKPAAKRAAKPRAKKSAAAKEASREQSRVKALEEVREIRDENERRARTHDRTEIHREIVGFDASGKEKKMEVHAHGGVVYLNTHGEIRLDQDGLVNLGAVRDEAFQAVS